MSTLVQASPAEGINVLAKRYADARATVAKRLAEYNEELRALQKKHLPGIKQSAAVAAARQGELAEELRAHPELFVNPRSWNIHGIRVGYRKGTGKIEWADDEKVAEKIRLLFTPEEFEVLVKTTHKPIAAALQALDVAVLKRLGCTVEGTADVVFIKTADTDVEKLVARILKEGTVEE